jgi:hypothetical protein
MKAAVGVALLLCVLETAEAFCPNGCSGNGLCGAADKCSCYAMYGGADCSLRMCPSALAWADTADGTNQAHYYAECANKGLCDRKTGECKCFDGYEGKGCRRAACPDMCSGHGTCELMSEMGGDYQDRRYGPGHKYQDLSCSSNQDGDPGEAAGLSKSCRKTGSFNGAGIHKDSGGDGSNSVFTLTNTAYGSQQCGAAQNEFCLHTYSLVGGGVGCDLKLEGATSTTGAAYSSGAIDLPNLADSKLVVVDAALYAHAVTGMAVTYAKGTGGTVPTAASEGTLYVYKHGTANTLVMFGTIAGALTAHADDAAAATAGLDMKTGAAGTAHTFIATDAYGATPSKTAVVTSSQLALEDTSVTTNSGLSVVVDATTYGHLATGLQVKYTTVSGTKPTALTDATSYFVYKHTGNANTITLTATYAHATAMTNDADAVNGGGGGANALNLQTGAAGTGSGDLDLSALAADKLVVVDAALYGAVSTGDAVTYAAGGGTVPTAAAEGTLYVYKHGTANTLVMYSTYATATVNYANDAAAVTAGLDMKTGSAGAAHTFTRASASTFALEEYGISFAVTGGSLCDSVPTVVVTATSSQAYIKFPTVTIAATQLYSNFGGVVTSNIVSRSANTDVSHGHLYQLWDADKQQACTCDLGYDGPDCAHRIAPHGDDPLTTVKSSPMKQVFQIGSPTVALNENKPQAEEFYIIYHDPYGGVWHTDGIMASNSDAVAASRVQVALNSLPNEVMLDTKVVARTNDADVMCTRMWDGAEHISGHPDGRKGSWIDRKNRPNWCEQTYTMATHTNKMDFVVEFGGNPGQTGVQYLMEVDINTRGPGSFPVSQGLTGANMGYSVAEMNFNENLGNLSELAECSDRGLDDGEGQCECFEGFRGLACEKQEALV